MAGRTSSLDFINWDPMLEGSVIAHSRLLYDSFKNLTGESLVEGTFASEEELARAMYYAPVVIVSHDTQDDPVFNYANEAAQFLWEMSWDEFTKLPSRFSVEPAKMSEREALLESTRKEGIIKGYKGVRISRSGKRFMIKDATLWNVYNELNLYCGQAARFATWDFVAKE